MTKEPFLAQSELTNEIYIVIGKEKYCVTRQAIKAVAAIKALEQEPILDKIRAEIHATAELHEDGDYYLRDEWIDEILDKYKAETEDT